MASYGYVLHSDLLQTRALTEVLIPEHLAMKKVSISDFCTGERGPALVPDGERADAADREGTGGLRDGESSVHPQ